MKKHLSELVRLTGLLCALTGCAMPTAFEGDPKFPGGAAGCWKKCQGQNLDMASFVYVGEYSTACACKPRLVNAPQAVGTNDDDDDQAAVVAAAAGVELQRRRIEEQQRAAAASAGAK
jgi:hypothetical protein